MFIYFTIFIFNLSDMLLKTYFCFPTLLALICILRGALKTWDLVNKVIFNFILSAVPYIKVATERIDKLLRPYVKIYSINHSGNNFELLEHLLLLICHRGTPMKNIFENCSSVHHV